MEEWKRNLIVLWLSQLFSLIGMTMAFSFIPFFLQELGMQGREDLRVWSGYYMASSRLTMALAAPFWGILADRFGRKPMALRANLGGGLLFLSMAAVRTPGQLIALRVAQGLLTNTVTANLTLVVARTPRDRLGFAIGSINAAVFTGNSLGPLLGGISSDLIGYRATFLVACAFFMVSFLLILFFVQEDFTPTLRQAGTKFPARLRAILTRDQVPLLIWLVFLLACSRFMQRPIFPFLVHDISSTEVGVATRTGAVLAVGGITSIAAGVIFGRLADRGNTALIGILSSVLAALFAVPHAFVSGIWQLVAVQGLFAFFAGGLDPIINTILARRVSPQHKGIVFGFTGSAKSMGWSAGALLGGYTAAYLSIPAVFIITAVLFLLTAVFLGLIRRDTPTVIEEAAA